jgi:hypothetical protein
MILGDFFVFGLLSKQPILLWRENAGCGSLLEMERLPDDPPP